MLNKISEFETRFQEYKEFNLRLHQETKRKCEDVKNELKKDIGSLESSIRGINNANELKADKKDV